MTRESYKRLKKIAEDKINKTRHFTNTLDILLNSSMYSCCYFLIFMIVLICHILREYFTATGESIFSQIVFLNNIKDVFVIVSVIVTDVFHYGFILFLFP